MCVCICVCVYNKNNNKEIIQRKTTTTTNKGRQLYVMINAKVRTCELNGKAGGWNGGQYVGRKKLACRGYRNIRPQTGA